MNDTSSKTHYAGPTHIEEDERHVLSVLVDNEAGVLARVVSLFSGRGFNIDSLTVSEVDTAEHLSRITIATIATPMVVEQIKAQLGRLVPIHSVEDLTVAGPHVERELALVKVVSKGDKRVEALRLADAFRAQVVDATTESFIFEITGRSTKLNQFMRLMEPLGLTEAARTGIAAIGRGPQGLEP